MKSLLSTAAAALAVLVATTSDGATAATAAKVTGANEKSLVELWRLDCGSLWISNLDEYSDTRAYVGQSRRFVASCYLIRHGDAWMLWDTGLSTADLGKPLLEGKEDGETLRMSIVDQLAKLDLKPQQISVVGISHYHFDHTGQAADFSGARLLMGEGDLNLLRQSPDSRSRPLEHWINGGGVVEAIVGDKDVFGDGSIVMVDLPGHTPGHHGLLLKLAHLGNVLLSGDVAHFRENLATNGVPSFNADRANSLASMDRFRALTSNLHATAIIQHEERDVGLLPAFPKSAD